MKFNLLIVAMAVFFIGCTTKELNTNADKVGGGVKNIENGIEDIVKGKN
jgi:hypothetical protein